MNQQERKVGFWAELWQELSQMGRILADGWGSIGVNVRNWMRTLRQAKIDYVVIPVGGHLPERGQPARTFWQRQLPLPTPPLSMEELNNRLRVVADADNVTGVLFVFQELGAGLATLQNLRRSIQRLREAGKDTVVFTPELDVPHYFVATAADRIVVPPSAQFNVFGLRAEVVFLKDALAQVGIQADMVPISPYKTAANQLSEGDITPEQREQLEWLLDEQFDLITQGMAEGRSMTQEQMQEMINQAPVFAEQALAQRLVDDVAYEDELPALLAAPIVNNDVDDDPEENEAKGADRDQATDASVTDASVDGASGNGANNPDKPEVQLTSWGAALPLLREKARRRHRAFIGVVSLEGAIAMGPSRRPPIDIPIPLLGGAMAGEQTLVALLRRAEQLEQMAALIFHVDSPGGSALASDLIGRQIERIARKKPVLVYMGNVAASGGYYVSAQASHIMCQTGTVTGSIGVISGRISVQGLYEKLQVNQVNIDRGARIGLYRNVTPMEAEERDIFHRNIVDTYKQFKQVVAQGRDIAFDSLDPICEGRVWSGRQAAGHQLIDGHGDFVDAVRQAAILAELPIEEDLMIPVVNLFVKSGNHVPPQAYSHDSLLALGRFLAGKPWQQFNGQPLLVMPFEIRF